jgi:hypothetical protein
VRASKYVVDNNKGIVVSYDYCIKFFEADKGRAAADKLCLAI